jgi:hypothetical protein
MLNNRNTFRKILSARFIVGLLVFLPLSFFDVFTGRINSTELLGPVLIALAASIAFTIIWLMTFAMIKTLLRLFKFTDDSGFTRALLLAEFVSLYVFITGAFVFYYYAIENPGNGLSFGVSSGTLLENGKLTELGVRDALNSIAGVTAVSAVLQFVSALHLVSKINFDDKKHD